MACDGREMTKKTRKRILQHGAAPAVSPHHPAAATSTSTARPRGGDARSNAGRQVRIVREYAHGGMLPRTHPLDDVHAGGAQQRGRRTSTSTSTCCTRAAAAAASSSAKNTPRAVDAVYAAYAIASTQELRGARCTGTRAHARARTRGQKRGGRCGR